MMLKKTDALKTETKTARALQISKVLALRGTVLLLGYVLVMMTAIIIVPEVSKFLHNGMVTLTNGSLAGIVSYWLAPLLLILALLTVLVFLAMRGMWRMASKVIARGKNKNVDVAEATPTLGKTQRIQSEKSRKPKGSK